jgi:hypothetical protein
MTVNISLLPPPLDEIVIEIEPGGYKDFGVSPDNPYPMKGAHYATAYGEIPGYIGEDGHALDVFVGSLLVGQCGYFMVYCGAGPDGQDYTEHKYYLAMSEQELTAVLQEFDAVMRGHESIQDIPALITAIGAFQQV